MKKLCFGATCLLFLAACYTPLNNSGVATTKKWLEISAKKTDFDGKQYDSCYRFNLRFWPQEAAGALDLREACVSACCWRGEKPSVTLDFNKNFDKTLAERGRAYYYTPGKITLSVSHSSLLNTTRVSADPKGAVSSDGLVKLKYKLVEDPARLARLDELARSREASLAARRARLESQERREEARLDRQNRAEGAKSALMRAAGGKIDGYFYAMDKAHKQKGWVFLVSERILTPRETGEAEYRVSCRARVRRGPAADRLKKSTLSCGTWTVNLGDLSVLPHDARARDIQDRY